MKTKRGRPRGSKYPQPDNIFKGMWSAQFGKIGAAAAMHIVIKCPHREIRYLESLPPDMMSTKWDKQRLKRTHRDLKNWNPEVGQLIGEKIASGDSAFFHELALAIEAISKGGRSQTHSVRRYLALERKLACDLWGEPFTLKALRDYYALHKHKIDSSTLSKIHQWAKSAEGWRKLPDIPDQQAV